MCDGDYDGGCNDPDYYDIQFREQNPEIYGNDEVMQEYYGSENDEQFHQEYLRWKRNHPNKIKSFHEEPKPKRPTNDPSNFDEWPNIIIFLILVSIFTFLFIKACG